MTTAPHSFSLAGRVALVTGGTRGIGKAIALAFAAAGARVVVASRKADAVDATAGELRALGADARGLVANVGKPGEAKRLVDETVAAFGSIGILVNNAAVNPTFGPVENTGTDAFDKIMAVNVRAPFDLAKEARPHFVAAGGGVILNISSIGAITPDAGLGIYSVSKAALVSLTQVLAKEWGKDNVRANAICPGLIRTDFSSALWKNEKILEHMMTRQAIQTLGEPEDIAGLALFLCSDAGRFCTGGVYMADGGYTA
jgi:NAD(P)-dependent dehydrogenase (short-subunit alcohol dehydrogenase family)